MNYPGQELENFERAHFWRKYIYFLIRNYLKDNILEVGAGIGSFTKNYIKQYSNILITETDRNNLKNLRNRFKGTKVKISKNFTKDLKSKYKTIMYLNVLEHIKDDKKEIKTALNKLKKGGYLIILVPAHNKLYSKFDKAIGHFRRYEISFFKNLNLKGAEIKKLYFLDCCGYFLYYINKIFFKKEVYPSILKIFIWDKIFTPLTILLDKLSSYSFAKNILCVIRKN